MNLLSKPSSIDKFQMSDFAEKKAEEEEVPKVEKTEDADEEGDDGPAPVSGFHLSRSDTMHELLSSNSAEMETCSY